MIKHQTKFNYYAFVKIIATMLQSMCGFQSQKTEEKKTKKTEMCLWCQFERKTIG